MVSFSFEIQFITFCFDYFFYPKASFSLDDLAERRVSKPLEYLFSNGKSFE